MATTTTYYGMSKPTLLEAADIRVINGDIDTIDRVMHSHMVSMAPVFNPASTYNVGDLVMYNDILYRCKTAISTASAWDATKWDATNIVDEFPEGGGGGGGSIDYSTTEQNTGLKWIDGKDIYQIVVSDTMPDAVTEGTTVMKQVSAVSGIDTIVSMAATIKNSSTNYIALPYVTDSTSSAKVQYDTGNGYLKLYNAILNFNSAPVNVILQYTKTSS